MAQLIEVPGLGQVEFPDGMSDAAIGAAIRKTLGAKLEQPEPTGAEKIAAHPITRFAVGAAKPIFGAAQLAVNAVSKDGGKAINDHLAQLEEMTKRGSRGGSTLGEVADFAGQVMSPVNLLMGGAVPAVTSTLGRAAAGTAIGAVGGAINPVMEGKDYWGDKAAQVGTSAALGGVAAPLVGKLADALVPKVNSLIERFKNTSPNLQQIDTLIKQGLDEIGARQENMTKQQIDALRQQVTDALKRGKTVDAAALMRKADFEELGIVPTRGQITRDPTQFAKERNLRGVPGVGEPLMQRFDTQNQKIQELVQALKGNPAEPYQAGVTLRDTLSGVDAGMGKNVSAAYKMARESSGKEAEVGLTGLAQDYADIVHRFGSKVPDGIRNQFKQFGLESGTQSKLFTVEEADKLLKEINKQVGADSGANTALSELRAAVKKAMAEGPADDVFATARDLASKRFKLQEAIPALEAAASGEAPDNFVRNYVLNGKVEEVQRLAKLLKSTNPEAFDQARAQIGDKISRAAFGENMAGDALAAPDRLARELRTLGTDKVKAFYTDAEIEQMKRIARVVAYINKKPSDAPVNTSNNMGGITSIASRLPGPIGFTVGVGKAATNAGLNQLAVNNALNTAIKPTNAPMSESQRKALAKALMLGVGGAAMAQ